MQQYEQIYMNIQQKKQGDVLQVKVCFHTLRI